VTQLTACQSKTLVPWSEVTETWSDEAVGEGAGQLRLDVELV
jgi:hypothetical protein